MTVKRIRRNEGMDKLTNELNNETVLRSQTDMQAKTVGQCNSQYNKFTHSINTLNLKNHIANM